MKKLLIAAVVALASMNTHAQSQAMMVNNAGGEIVLTQETCRGDARFLKVLSTNPNGTVLEGCWNYVKPENYVRVVWIFVNGRVTQPDVRMYPINSFRFR